MHQQQQHCETGLLWRDVGGENLYEIMALMPSTTLWCIQVTFVNITQEVIYFTFYIWVVSAH